MEIAESLTDIIGERGPLTVAAFMDLALYHPEFGYYARAARRSGRAGDFFTSVDVGPLFGELLEIQIEEMFQILCQPPATSHQPSALSPQPFDLVEVGAGNGRLSTDILRAAQRRDPAFYDSVHLHLVETSATARGAQHETLGDVAARLSSSGASLPDSFEGVLIANELLDAFPVHQVVMREDGLREVYVARTTSAARPLDSLGVVASIAEGRGVSRASDALQIVEGPPSTPALQDYLERADVTLEPAWRVEINLRAVDWVRESARRLRRGFLILIDYGHPARELYSVAHASGTLTAFSGHRSAGPEVAGAPAWLERPGEQDLTAHVDFTSIQVAAEAEGLTTIGFLDQTYFLLGLLPSLRNPQSSTRNLNTLVQPGGLGSTHKVLILGKGVGTPSLRGCSFSMRVT
ncbi:MAG: SAM-dependent methyltransferase [Acidobacteria bacterium]|nr:SAM-dependent methyltransferase [Acidobacteriota bacterium]